MCAVKSMDTVESVICELRLLNHLRRSPIGMNSQNTQFSREVSSLEFVFFLLTEDHLGAKRGADTLRIGRNDWPCKRSGVEQVARKRPG